MMRLTVILLAAALSAANSFGQAASFDWEPEISGSCYVLGEGPDRKPCRDWWIQEMVENQINSFSTCSGLCEPRLVGNNFVATCSTQPDMKYLKSGPDFDFVNKSFIAPHVVGEDGNKGRIRMLKCAVKGSCYCLSFQGKITCKEKVGTSEPVAGSDDGEDINGPACPPDPQAGGGAGGGGGVIAGPGAAGPSDGEDEGDWVEEEGDWEDEGDLWSEDESGGGDDFLCS